MTFTLNITIPPRYDTYQQNSQFNVKNHENELIKRKKEFTHWMDKASKNHDHFRQRVDAKYQETYDNLCKQYQDYIEYFKHIDWWNLSTNDMFILSCIGNVLNEFEETILRMKADLKYLSSRRFVEESGIFLLPTNKPYDLLNKYYNNLLEKRDGLLLMSVRCNINMSD